MPKVRGTPWLRGRRLKSDAGPSAGKPSARWVVTAAKNGETSSRKFLGPRSAE